MSESILSPPFLFRFATQCRHAVELWPARGAGVLGEEYRLPSFAELEGKRSFADLRMGWNEEGLGFELSVIGKSQGIWCRDARVEDSDGLSVWIDTRDTHNVHRASRFCHRFVFLPAGGGARSDQPVAVLLPINRARELCKPVEPKALRVSSSKVEGGYSMRCFVPAAALTGYDPNENPKLGFTYAVTDRELGWQTFSVGPEFPFAEDPSLWGTVELK
jgi:hypothetical protein